MRYRLYQQGRNDMASPSYEELKRCLFYITTRDTEDGLMVIYFTYTGGTKSSSQRLFPCC
jgi:hypothetical protein